MGGARTGHGNERGRVERFGDLSVVEDRTSRDPTRYDGAGTKKKLLGNYVAGAGHVPVRVLFSFVEESDTTSGSEYRGSNVSF